MAEIVYHLYESAHNFNDGVNTAVNLIPQQWNRFTVTDGLAFTENTLSALHYRDVYLANAIESVSSELTNKYSAGLGIYINTATNTISRNITENDYKYSKEFGVLEDPDKYNVSLNISHDADNRLGFDSNGFLTYSYDGTQVTSWIAYNEIPEDNPTILPSEPTDTKNIAGGSTTTIEGITSTTTGLPTTARFINVDISHYAGTLISTFGGPNENYAEYTNVKMPDGTYEMTDIVTSAKKNGHPVAYDIFDPFDRNKFGLTAGVNVSGGQNYITDSVDMVPDNVFFIW